MTGSEPRPFRPKLTLVQMMKLVIFGAVGSACLAPIVRLVEIRVANWSAVLVMGGVSVPLVLALACFPLVRRGPLKDWSIRALLAISLGMAIGFALWTFARIVSAGVGPGRSPDYASLAGIIGVVLVLGLGLSQLLRGLIPHRCPECRRRLLLPYATDRQQPGDARGRPYRCIACEAKAFRPIRSRRTPRPGPALAGTGPFAKG